MDRQYAHAHTPHLHDGSSSQRPTPHATPGPIPGLPPPSAAQPPVQMSFADPFHHRDPFMPPAHHRREKSYGSILTGSTPVNGERAWLPPTGAPQPMPQPPPYGRPPNHPNDHHRPPAAWDRVRRRSLDSPSRLPGARPDHPIPPPFAPRNMPPPSPSASTTPSYSSNTTRPYPPPPHYGAPPETNPTRHTGGISITSLIGQDRPVQVDRSPQAATTHNSPTFRSHHPLSPKRARSTSVRSEFGRPARPLSPRSHAYNLNYREEPRQYAPRNDYGPPPMPGPAHAPSFRPYQSSPTTDHFPNGSQRPNSQPSVIAPQDQAEHWRHLQAESRPVGNFREYNPGSVELERQRSDESRYVPHRDGLQYDGQPAGGPAQYSARPYHLGGERYNEQESRAHDHKDISRAPRDGRVAQRPASPPFPSDKNGAESRFRQYPTAPHERELNGTTTPLTSSFSRRDEDVDRAARSHLTVSPEIGRKNGRSSPLPQAVQGAQPQLMGPGRDPSIKNEFGRMFSGLGSGLGGSSTPNGPFSAAGNLTPSRLSPSRFPDRESSPPVEPEKIVDGQSMLHAHGHVDPIEATSPDEAEGRSTPSLANGNKRVKTKHPAHHHHHHAHNHVHAHHHHHHHHAVAEEGPANKGGYSTIRFPPATNGTPDSTARTSHHHHHHHGVAHNHVNHHHHHSAPSSSTKPLPPLVVRSEDVVAATAELPRAHLGSALYTTELALPATKRTHLIDTRLFFDSTTTALPLFEDRGNCTFTVRVPREYLRIPHGAKRRQLVLAGGLEEICRRRAVWGTDIYTDDSDIVAAAVHAGWIKGSFGAEVDKDVSLLFPNEVDDARPSSATDQAITVKPALPVTIPRDRDLHVTVLLLPPLSKYSGSTRHNLKSREWGDNHDGMSYMIHAVEFVDEPAWSRFEARAPAARKKRLREELSRRMEAADVLVGMNRDLAVGA